jgi:hypothetical protein
MVLVTTNWRMWLAGTAVSLVIFAVLFFTVIQPSTDTANQAIKSGIQQSQQAINQAQKQLSSASGQAGAGAGAGQAQKVLSKAAKLTSCVAAAGTDPTKMQACQVKYAN